MFFSQVFKLEGQTDCYLFVKPGKINWAICSDLKGEKRFIRSGSAGLRCPASPENKFGKNSENINDGRICENINDWQFNKAGDDGKEDWREGGIVVQCTVHEQTTADQASAFSSISIRDGMGRDIAKKPLDPRDFQDMIF